jgi:phosphoribosylamine--glycine ligase
MVGNFQENGLRAFGPSAAASQLESSKTYTKELCIEKSIPTADYDSFTDEQPARDYALKLAQK